MHAFAIFEFHWFSYSSKAPPVTVKICVVVPTVRLNLEFLGNGSKYKVNSESPPSCSYRWKLMRSPKFISIDRIAACALSWRQSRTTASSFPSRLLRDATSCPAMMPPTLHSSILLSKAAPHSKENYVCRSAHRPQHHLRPERHRHHRPSLVLWVASGFTTNTPSAAVTFEWQVFAGLFIIFAKQNFQKHNSSAREPSPVQPRSRSSCTPGEPSPVKLRKSSLTSSPADDPGDEGFLDLKEVEQDEYQSCGISGLDKLISAPVLNASLPKVKPDSIPNAAKPKCVRHLQSQLLLNDSFEIKERPAVSIPHWILSSHHKRRFCDQTKVFFVSSGKPFLIMVSTSVFYFSGNAQGIV